jgi:DMSO/TMAO reductase YedYZ molybdopterin-dependent catalytic subunit
MGMQKEVGVSVSDERARLFERRRFLQGAVSGTLVTVLGVAYALSDELTAEAAEAKRPDGKLRLPPGQRVLGALKPMGGEPGDPRLSAFRLKIHGAVKKPFELDFRGLRALPTLERTVDVHCVTGWSLLGAKFTGVQLMELAKRAEPEAKARHVVFEAAHGYTANVPIDEALAPNNLVTWEHNGTALAAAHGGPVRGLVPDLYFWKSAKWLTGIRFVEFDQPGYWETRGYHNHADPWREERYG